VRIALTGPIDLELLQPHLSSLVRSAGYRFPMTAHLAVHLLDQGHDVVVVALDPSASDTYRLRGPSLDVLVSPMRPRARDRALDVFRAERRGIAAALHEAAPEVVHAHWTYEFALAALRTGLPHLITAHDWAPAVLAQHPDAYRAVRLAMQARVVRSARHLTAVSPYLQSRLGRWSRVPVALVPNGLPDSYFRPSQHVVTDNAQTVFGCLVAGVDRLKNLAALLEAFGRLRGRRGEVVRLRVAGGGTSQGEALHRWARDHRLLAGVEFLGGLNPSDVPDYLTSLDVFVHPSLEESFGMVIVEAMAAHVPVIGGARSGAVPWVLDDGAAGLLVDVRRPDALADAMESLLDPDARHTLAEAGRRRADDFSMSVVAERYVGEYHRALAHRR
jgi:L-malate glycosyltransferase